MNDLEQLNAREARDSIRLNTLPYAIRCRVSEFTGAELKLFVCLLSHANNESNRVWAGLKLLMRETGLSENGIDNAIAGLKKKGWITRFQLRDTKTGQRRTASTFCKWAAPEPNSMYAKIIERKKSKDDG